MSGWKCSSPMSPGTPLYVPLEARETLLAGLRDHVVGRIDSLDALPMPDLAGFDDGLAPKA